MTIKSDEEKWKNIKNRWTRKKSCYALTNEPDIVEPKNLFTGVTSKLSEIDIDVVLFKDNKQAEKSHLWPLEHKLSSDEDEEYGGMQFEIYRSISRGADD